MYLHGKQLLEGFAQRCHRIIIAAARHPKGKKCGDVNATPRRKRRIKCFKIS